MKVYPARLARPSPRGDPKRSHNSRYPLNHHKDGEQTAGLSINAILMLLHKLGGARRYVLSDIRTSTARSEVSSAVATSFSSQATAKNGQIVVTTGESRLP